ncbi:hypothetical protein [Brachybacterium hainanense]|uniref:Uncharacterized protein n=1 Tax=Brachybacterium hainanense TaxID=1541174 RepID=A0ABV6RBH0_9MICO
MTSPREGPRVPAVATAGLGLLLAVGCSSPSIDPAPRSAGPPPIEVVSTAGHIGQPIDLDLPVHPSGAFEFDQWPSACQLVDQKAITSVLPGVTETAQESRPAEISIITLMDPDADTGPFTVPEASCGTSAGFDVDGLRLSDGNVVMNFLVEVTAAGTPEYIERNADLPSGEEVQLGDATCVASEHRYDCATDSFAFSVSLDARPYAQYVDGGDSIYRVDGEEVDYSDDVDGFLAMTDEKILLPVVTSAAERLSA